MKDFFLKKRICLLLSAAMLLALCACGGEIVAAEVTPTPPPMEAPAPAVPDLTETTVVLSELMSANRSAIRDGNGEWSDYIELWNSGSEAADLTGFWLSDDGSELCKWQFPALTLQGDERRVIFMGGETVGDELHASFSLSSSGETLYLSSPGGFLLWEFPFASMGKDAVLSLVNGEMTLSYEPTPGFPNDEAGREDFLTAFDRPGDLRICEAVLYNDSYDVHAGDAYDWVQLTNFSGGPIQLADYYLFNEDGFEESCRLPAYSLEAGGSVVIFCGEPQGTTSRLHVPFTLDGEGDVLYLYRADGTFSDCMGMYDLPLDTSKGRLNGENGFFFFDKCTPEGENTNGWRRASAMPVCLTEPGIYNGVEYVSVELQGSGVLHYTLDGSLPTAESPVYTGPIDLFSTRVVRVINCVEGDRPSEVATFSFLINEGHTLPVVSLSCQPRLFKELYYASFWAKPYAHIEFFDGEKSFSQDCALTLHGTSARTVWIKKNFKVIFRSRYGGDTDFPFFGEEGHSYHSLLLRGGNTLGMQIYRDSLASLLANEVAVTDPMTLDSRYCILYVNGEYWGIFALREAYSEEYVADHTGADDADCTVVRVPVTVDRSRELNELFSFIANHDMAEEENYRYAADRFDMLSLAQWLCIETFYNNMDPTGNIRYVKSSQPDGKWRTALFDFDIAMANRTASMEAILRPDAQIGNVLGSLRRSPEFCRLVLETASELYKNGMTVESLLFGLQALIDTLEPEIERDMKRWDEDFRQYENAKEWQRSFFGEERQETYLSWIRYYCFADDETMAAYFP